MSLQTFFLKLTTGEKNLLADILQSSLVMLDYEDDEFIMSDYESNPDDQEVAALISFPEIVNSFREHNKIHKMKFLAKNKDAIVAELKLNRERSVIIQLYKFGQSISFELPTIIEDFDEFMEIDAKFLIDDIVFAIQSFKDHYDFGDGSHYDLTIECIKKHQSSFFRSILAKIMRSNLKKVANREIDEFIKRRQAKLDADFENIDRLI